MGYLTGRDWWCVSQLREIERGPTTLRLLEAATHDNDLTVAQLLMLKRVVSDSF